MTDPSIIEPGQTSLVVPPNSGHTGLVHVAFSYPDRTALARAYQRVADHGVSEALYFDDPDGNGVERSWDCPPERWTCAEGGILNVAMNEPFDPATLRAELDEP